MGNGGAEDNWCACADTTCSKLVHSYSKLVHYALNGAQYMLCVMYNTCGLSIRANRLPCTANYLVDFANKYIS